MTTFSAALALCGLTQTTAADYLGVRLDTLKSWSSGRNPVPQGVWQMLADLWARIENAADVASAEINLDDMRVWANLAADDADGLPNGADNAAGAMALLLAINDLESP